MPRHFMSGTSMYPSMPKSAIQMLPSHTPLTHPRVQPDGKEPAAVAAPAADGPSADGASEQPSTSSSFISGSVLRVHFAGEGALPDFATVREALGGRDAGIRFVEVVEEVSLHLTAETCPHLPRPASMCTFVPGHLHVLWLAGRKAQKGQPMCRLVGCWRPALVVFQPGTLRQPESW